MANYTNVKGFTVQTVSSDPVADKYSGAAWTSASNTPAGVYENAGAGATQTASLMFGGQTDASAATPGKATGDTFTWNGSSWSEVN